MTVANKKNYCGGEFSDWICVIPSFKCNGICSWCIEKDGDHGFKEADYGDLIDAVHAENKTKIMILGGEPLVYKDLGELVSGLVDYEVYLTSNGTNLDVKYWAENYLEDLTGVNLSIHHYNLAENEKITGINIDETRLELFSLWCRRNDIKLRYNCNIFKGGLETREDILNYIQWAKEKGVDEVKLEEIRGDDNHVKLENVLTEYNLVSEPFTEGCLKELEINGLTVFVRQVCGLETANRLPIINPKGLNQGRVIYPDGSCLRGWSRKIIEDMHEDVFEDIYKIEVDKEVDEWIKKN